MRAELRLRITYPQGSIGPGKVHLLEAIEQTGSISAAARTVGMSFRRAWFLIDTMNQAFREPVVKASPGGRTGGTARLTPFGLEVVSRYRAIEEEASRLALAHLERFDEALLTTADPTTRA